MQPAIEIEGLRKAYGDVEAVRDISFSVAAGEVFCLLGPNGAGKTTTTEILEGYRARSAGELLVEWDEVAARLPGWMREHGTRPLNDVVIHEQDLRGAVGAPGGRGSDGLAIVRDVAEIYEGTASLEESEDLGGLMVRLRLPAA